MSSPDTVELAGLPIWRISTAEVLDHVARRLEQNAGGWLVTANVDILLQSARNPDAKRAYLAADHIVADGMPLVWASRIAGRALPERVAGSTLCEPLIASCARRRRPVLLLGGTAGTAERAAQLMSERYGGEVHGYSNATFGMPPTDDQLRLPLQWIKNTKSRLILVGLGSPKQELVIERLRQQLPEAWFMGVGGSFGFLAGEVPRAPGLMQQVGLEWVHRLVNDPKRLGKRYLRDDLPFAFRLLFDAARSRFRA